MSLVNYFFILKMLLSSKSYIVGKPVYFPFNVILILLLFGVVYWLE